MRSWRKSVSASGSSEKRASTGPMSRRSCAFRCPAGAASSQRTCRIRSPRSPRPSTKRSSTTREAASRSSAQSSRTPEAFVDLYKSRNRVLDLGSGRGIFLQLLKEHGIGGYGVDLDPRMVAQCREKGLEAHEVDALTHLRQVEAGSVDGLYARHLAEH